MTKAQQAAIPMSRKYHQQPESKDYRPNVWNQQVSEISSGHYSYSPHADHDFRNPGNSVRAVYGAELSGYSYSLTPEYILPSPLPPLSTHLRQGVIYLGVSTKPNTLLGSCAWWLLEPNGAAIASGAIPVVQKFPSVLCLEFKALFHALNCANVNGVRVLTIRTTSCMVIDSIMRQFQGRGITCMKTVYHMMNELCDPLWKAFERLHHYDIELIDPVENMFSQRLADRTFYKFSKRNLSEIK